MNDYDIQISDRQEVLSVDEQQLRRTVVHVLQRQAVDRAVVSVALVDDRAIRFLVKKYYDRDEPTDVLSFDLHAPPRQSPASAALDCEVVVNAQRALKLAQQAGGDPVAELHLYLVHGLLHQLGYDDRTEIQARKMHQKEDQLTRELGFGPVYSQNL